MNPSPALGYPRCVSEGTHLTTTNATAVFAADEGIVGVIAIRIANITGGAVTATVGWYDASASTTYVLNYQCSVAANDDLTIEPSGGLWLETGDEVRVTAGSGNALDVIVTAYASPARNR